MTLSERTRRYRLRWLAAAIAVVAGGLFGQNPVAPQTPGVRPLVLNPMGYRLGAGSRTEIAAPLETIEFWKKAKTHQVKRTNAAFGRSGFTIGLSPRGNQLVLATSLTTPPGQYNLEVSAIDESGEQRTASFGVILDPPQAVPSTSTKPPVVLLNGFQISCPGDSMTETFGQLDTLLKNDDVPVIYFFDNCAECPGCAIEDIANILTRVLDLIRYDTNALVPQVDLIAHSMGGLIARSYLAGLQTNGEIRPPPSPRIRKLIQIATPNFGSFEAWNVGSQVSEMFPASNFLWNLARWNQGMDDLRGVDALAIVGSGGYEPFSNASDGIVSLVSASLSFTRDGSRTRILPYCHTDSGFLVNLVMDCNGFGIANVDHVPETAQIIRSFLANTTGWMSLGSTPVQDPWLSQWGGMYFALVNTLGGYFGDLTQVSWASLPLNSGGATNMRYYREFVKGTGDVVASSNSLGVVTCGPFTASVGYYFSARCKYGPSINAVGPLLATGTPARIVRSGSIITLSGSGFGAQQCGTCTVRAGSLGSIPLAITSWSDQTITAQLPAYDGFFPIIVQTATGSDSINIMAAPVVPCPVSLTPLLLQPSSSGGAFAIRVQTGPQCYWSASVVPNWITVVGANSGTGLGNITLVIAPNTGAARTTAFNVAGTVVTVNQAAGGGPFCVYSVNPSGRTFPASGGSGIAYVIVNPGCPWALATAPAWSTFTTAISGMGSGVIAYQVPANLGGYRSGDISAATFSWHIEQSGASLPGNVSSVGSLAQIASAGTWKMILTALNLGAGTAQTQLNFFDNNGGSLPLPLTFPQASLGAEPILASTLDRTIPPNAQMVIESTGPDGQTASVGWGQLLGPPGVSGFSIFSNSALKWEAVVPLETRNASSYTLAFDNTGTLATGLALANLAGQAANVNAIIRSDTGAILTTASIGISALGHTSFMLTDNYPITVGKRGTVEFQTPPGGRISILGLRANGPALTTLPVLAGVGTAGGSIAHILYDGGFTNNFTLVNTGTTSASATLSFFSEGGVALTTPLFLPQTGETFSTSAITRVLAPGASLLIETVGSETRPVVVGSALLTTTGNVGGFGIFCWTQFGQEASVPVEDRQAASYVLTFDNTNGLTTGLALANVAGSVGVIPVTIRDDAGTVLLATTITLAARAHTAFMLPDVYAIAAGKRGTIEFGTPGGGRVSVIGLRATPSGNLTTIPVLSK